MIVFVLSLLLTTPNVDSVTAPRNLGGLTGVVRDDTKAVLPTAAVTVRGGDGRIAAHVVSDQAGRYRVDGLTAGAYSVEIALPNFATRRYADVRIEPGQMRTLDATLSLTITADISVTARRSFRNLAQLDSVEGGLIGIAAAASEGLVTGRQIDARPVQRVGEVLETIPGVVISQHSGEGKANQYYLRGFNLDHGTDFATSVAGVPVNLPTHAHGQGYSDLNFLIPELVSAVQFRKGLYSAEQGDFSTAGASHVRYATVLERPIMRLSVGGDGWRRVFGAVSPRVGNGHFIAAVDSAHNDGPWRRPDDYGKLNTVVGYSRGDARNGFAVLAMTYRGSWDATDQAPTRAVESGELARFDGIDHTTGGESARYSLSTDWQQTRGSGVTRVNAYLLRYRLNLFSNFTYFLDDPVNGDQFEQADRRWVTGGRVTHRRIGVVAGKATELVVGAELRRDDIGDVGVHRTVARQRLATVRQDAVTQSSSGLFVEQEIQWAPWARTSFGVRGDRYWFDVEAGNPLNSGLTSAGLFSPKAGAVVGPWRNTELYLNAGTGFHSNDARGTTISVDPVSGDPVDRVTPLVRARGAEIGLRSIPRRGLHTTLSIWTLTLDSELLFVGDAGNTTDGRPSTRSGVELTAFYTPRPWLTVDADFSFARARFRDDDAAGSQIPGALGRVLSAGIAIADSSRIGGSLRVRHFGPRDLVEDGRVQSHSTTIVNGRLQFRATERATVVVDLFNILDAKNSDIEYFYRSRLNGEPGGGREDIHSHPALPRTIRLGLQIGF